MTHTPHQAGSLRKEWLKVFQPPEMVLMQNPDGMLSCPLCGVKAEEIADWWLSHLHEVLEQVVEEIEGDIMRIAHQYKKPKDLESIPYVIEYLLRKANHREHEDAGKMAGLFAAISIIRKKGLSK